MQLQLSAAESRRAQYALYVALVANSFALASVFPYAGFMVKNGFHMVDDDREVGFFAGFVMTNTLPPSRVRTVMPRRFSSAMPRAWRRRSPLASERAEFVNPSRVQEHCAL